MSCVEFIEPVVREVSNDELNRCAQFAKALHIVSNVLRFGKGGPHMMAPEAIEGLSLELAKRLDRIANE